MKTTERSEDGQGIRRMFREFLNPGLKCERIGHDMRDQREVVFLYPPTGWLAHRSVAERVVEITPRCSRCPHVGEVEVRERVSLQGLTLSDESWEKLRRDGRLIA